MHPRLLSFGLLRSSALGLTVALSFWALPSLAAKPRPLPVIQKDLAKKPGDLRLLTEIGKIGTEEAARVLVESQAFKEKPRNVLRALGGIRDPKAAVVLHPLLSHDEKLVRSGTARLLEKLQSPASAAPLLKALNAEKDASVKRAVIQALGPTAGTPQEFRPVLDLLEDKEFGRNAVHAMKNIQEPKLAPLLFPYMKSKDVRLRRDIAKTLGQLGASVSGTVLLDAIAKDKNRGVVSEATRSLATASGPQHLPRMMKMLKRDSRPNLALAKAVIAVDRTQNFKVLKAFFRRTKRSKKRADKQLRKTFVSAIQADPHPSDDVIALELLKSRDDQDRRIAMGALGAVGSPAARDALCRSLKKFKKPAAMQGHAADALSRYQDGKAVKCLIDGFKAVKVYTTPSASPQRNIAKALRRMTGQNFEYDVKAWKAWQKASITSPKSAIAALGHDDQSVRALAARQVSDLKGKDRAAAISALTSVLAKEKKSGVRIAFVKALASLRPDGLVDILVPLLDTSNLDEIEVVAGALDAVGDGRGTLRLIEELRTSKAQEAASALARITGEPAHTNQKRWRAWWVENAERYRK